MSAEYMSGPHDSDNCSCQHDGVYWLKRCAAATANDRAESIRWAQDHIRRSPTTVFNAGYLKAANCIVQNGDFIHGHVAPSDASRWVTCPPTMAGPDEWHAINEDLR